MSGLTNDLVAFKKSVVERTRSCPVERLLGYVSLQEGDKAAKQARELLEDPMYSPDALCVVFRRNGYKISRESVRHHRCEECPCESR